MQLVILHHHLNRGGVTSVVENHLRSLALLKPEDRPKQAAIVYGGRAAAWNKNLAADLPFECSLIEVPELEYDNLRESQSSLHAALSDVLEQFDQASTILHIHNHSLGKNSELAPEVCRLADEGWRLLLQVHDFAEDLRPDNYRHMVACSDSVNTVQRELYPQAAQVHYSVLNQRDEQILDDAGVAQQRLHLLPNPVRAFENFPSKSGIKSAKQELARSLDLPAGQRLVLYPVRPIRRKNIGELLLWSLLAEKTTFALTLAPLNPQERISYQRWVDFAAELQLPVVFELASKTQLTFEEVYAAADAIVTTSVAEGFGMVYLEASLAQRQLVGRNLPGVCHDFLTAGMQFPGLAETMAIPAEQLDRVALEQNHRDICERLRTSYDLPSGDRAELPKADTVFSGATVDFGRLESSEQRGFLRRVKTEAALRETMRELNPTVQTIGSVGDEELQKTLEVNCRVIAGHYSPQVIGQRLGCIYQAILASTPERVRYEPSIAAAILDSFVHPSQLFPIRLES